MGVFALRCWSKNLDKKSMLLRAPDFLGFHHVTPTFLLTRPPQLPFLLGLWLSSCPVMVPATLAGTWTLGAVSPTNNWGNNMDGYIYMIHLLLFLAIVFIYLVIVFIYMDIVEYGDRA